MAQGGNYKLHANGTKLAAKKKKTKKNKYKKKRIL